MSDGANSEGEISRQALDIAYHNAIATEYDAVVANPRWSANSIAFARAKMLVGHRRRQLDVGCGTGHMLLRFADQVDSAVGIDHSAKMLDVAHASLQKAGSENVQLEQGDAEHYLKSSTEQFDLITSVGFLHHLAPSELSTYLNLMEQRLEPRGALVLADPVETQASPPEAIQRMNNRSYARSLQYSMEATDPDEAPLRYELLCDCVSSAGLKIEAAWRSWEMFPQHETPTAWERLKMRWLSYRHRRNGSVAFIVATAP